MFRKMRRTKQEMKKCDSEKVLLSATSGILAVQGDDDYPYAVPLSYIYHEGKIYFHSAKDGHKIDAIRNHDKVSFTVIDRDEIVAEEFTTYFRSVVLFGKARIIEDLDEKMTTLKILSNKYSPNLDEAMEKEIEGAFKHLLMVAVDIDHMTGKEAIELVKQRNKS